MAHPPDIRTSPPSGFASGEGFISLVFFHFEGKEAKEMALVLSYPGRSCSCTKAD